MTSPPRPHYLPDDHHDEGAHDGSLLGESAGACGQETAVEVAKTGSTTVSVSFTTTCEHVADLGEELTELNVASEMTMPLNETRTDVTAARHMCRFSCVVPAAVLKAMEATAGIYLPENCAIEFVEGAI